ncbi:hypothetical protein [Microcystis phage Mel-JY01]
MGKIIEIQYISQYGYGVQYSVYLDCDKFKSMVNHGHHPPPHVKYKYYSSSEIESITKIENDGRSNEYKITYLKDAGRGIKTQHIETEILPDFDTMQKKGILVIIEYARVNGKVKEINKRILYEMLREFCIDDKPIPEYSEIIAIHNLYITPSGYFTLDEDTPGTNEDVPTETIIKIDLDTKKRRGDIYFLCIQNRIYDKEYKQHFQ